MGRVVFYSKNDLSSGPNLHKAVPIIDNYNANKNFSINDILELYNIKLYFDNDMCLPSWSEADKTAFKKIVKQFWNSIVKFWFDIDNNNVIDLFNEVYFEFKKDFWELIEKLDTYKKIDSSTFKLLLNAKNFYVKDVLKHSVLVKYFGSELKDYFISNINSVELLLSYYEQENDFDNQKLYFPKQLNDLEKETLVLKYLDCESANLNYVRLIVSSRNIKLSDKTKLKAKGLSRKLNEEIITKGVSWKQGIAVSISIDQDEPVKTEKKGDEKRYSYSQKYLLGEKDPIEIFYNFFYPFGYINQQGCIELVNKTCHIDTFEKITMRSKNEYSVNSSFQHKHLLSSAQFTIYKYLLDENDISIEHILSYMVNEFLNSNFEVKDLKITFPSKHSSTLEKIRMIAPEMESLIKQYKIYIEEGFIDFELLEFASAPLNFSEVKSKVVYKYVYGEGDEFNRLRYYFFSNVSMLYYIDPYKGKYKNFYALITSEKVQYDNFEEYQKRDLDYLISENYLIINPDRTVEILNHDIIYIIALLHYEDVLNLWYYPEEIRKQIFQLEKKGILRFDNSLFTIEERRYLNFHLNKKEFTNGFDLRNKYLHGTNANSKKTIENDYNLLLKLLILVIFKIQDDLSLSEVERDCEK